MCFALKCDLSYVMLCDACSPWLVCMCRTRTRYWYRYRYVCFSDLSRDHSGVASCLRRRPGPLGTVTPFIVVAVAGDPHRSPGRRGPTLSRSYPLRAPMPSAEASDSNPEATASSRPTWDCSLTAAAFFEAVIKWLPKKDPNYRNIEQGHRRRPQTLFQSVNHINRYVNNEIKNSAGDKARSVRGAHRRDATRGDLRHAAVIYAASPAESSTDLKLSDSSSTSTHWRQQPSSAHVRRHHADWDDQDTVDEYEEDNGGNGTDLWLSFVLNQATVSWASKRQPTVALSSCEAEIMAGSEAAKGAIHYRLGARWACTTIHR